MDKTENSKTYVSFDVNEVLEHHYKNINSSYARKFKEELEVLGESQRMVRGAGRKRGLYLKVFYQAKKTGNVYSYRYVSSGADRPPIIPD